MPGMGPHRRTAPCCPFIGVALVLTSSEMWHWRVHYDGGAVLPESGREQEAPVEALNIFISGKAA
jgi:hypothetical protein